MIDKRLVPFSGLKKEPFSGSHQGMRYLLAADNGRDSTTFTAYVYPEPWCFEASPEEDKTLREFPFTPEGVEEAIRWLNASYEEKREYWKECEKNKMRF